jgi:hypothetical protein
LTFEVRKKKVIKNLFMKSKKKKEEKSLFNIKMNNVEYVRVCVGIIKSQVKGLLLRFY